MKKTYKELIAFFQTEDGWDKEDIISEYCEQILKANDCTINDQTMYPEHISLSWDTLDLPLTLEDFAIALFDKIIDGVCNVIKTQ